MANSKKKPAPKRGSVGAGDQERGESAAAVSGVPDEERYALALESIQHGVYDWDVVKGTIYYSPTVRKMFSMPPDMVLTPAQSGDRVHVDDVPRYRQAIVAHLKGETPRLDCEYRYLLGDTEWR